MRLLLLILALAFLVAFIQVGVVTVAFDKLGLSPESAYTLLFVSLIGSGINLPLFTVRSQSPGPDAMPTRLRLLFGQGALPPHGKTLIAVNVGGGLIPVFFSFYLLAQHPLSIAEVGLAIAGLSAIAYWVSRPVPGIGIGMPIFVAPISAALLAILLDAEQSAPLAYICGTLGVLIGADILRLKDVRQLGAPLASIGGAGTFDGIFITGMVAVLLA